MADSIQPATLPQSPGGLTAVLGENRAVLLRFLTRRLGNEAEAEDVLQDVWIKLSERPPGKPIGDPLAYLFRTAENAARDHRRSEARLHARESNYAEHQAGGDPDGGADHSPEEIAIERDALRAVEARLARMPDRTRAIFLAFRLDGAAQKQIAADHGISLSAVQKHLQRAYRAVVAEDASEEFAPPRAGKGRP